MAIRTKESLEKLFEASRLRQQRLKEQETKKYKKAQEAVKKDLAKQQSKKQEKTPQKGCKQPQIEFSSILTIYNTKCIERFVGEDDLYVTREQLKEAEARGEGKINWDRWDELVQRTKQDIKEELKGFEKMYTNTVFVYDILKQRVIKTFKSPKECAKYYNISRELVNTYIRDHRVYYKPGVEFRQ